ncbi:MAG TPA: ABC transporter ATP-binding protein [Actinomycetota bacterium]|nr:ABC transporter ATP-binding protein [Actinomycetota bacterium]
MTTPLLDVRDLRVHFDTPDGIVKAVDGVSFTISPSQRLGVVGESGSGKSVTFLTVMGLVERAKTTHIEGEVLFKGRNLLDLAQDELRLIRGAGMAMVFQDPMSSLHPLYRVGWQIVEAIRAHEKVSEKAAEGRAVEMLRKVGIPRPEERVRQYPHEYSGGMRQRAMIAMALSLSPDLLIADEPTTALDVTVQAQILALIDRLREEFGTAVVMITHDLGVVAEHTDDVMVMYAGKIAEYGSRDHIYYGAHHPYTWGLLQSISRLDEKQERLRPIQGSPPSLIFVPPGCPFHPRCPYRFDPCAVDVPELIMEEEGHSSACHLAIEDKKRIFEAEVRTRT